MAQQIELLLRADHAELDDLLEDVHEALGDGKFDRVYPALDLFWARLAMHIRAEHVRLFPAVINAVPEMPGLIDRLRHDHDFFMRELGRAIKILRSNGDESVAEVRSILGPVRERLVDHDRIEEERIYPLAAAVPPELYWEIKSELDNLPPRFEASSDG